MGGSRYPDAGIRARKTAGGARARRGGYAASPSAAACRKSGPRFLPCAPRSSGAVSALTRAETIACRSGTMFCAMDFSGNQESGNYKYLAIAVCTDEFLNSPVSDADLAGKTAAHKAGRRDTLSRLDARPGCLVLCTKTDKSAVSSKTTYMAQRQKKNPKKASPEYAYNDAVLDRTRDDIGGFLKRHGRSLQEIEAEADHDCKDLKARQHAAHQRIARPHDRRRRRLGQQPRRRAAGGSGRSMLPPTCTRNHGPNSENGNRKPGRERNLVAHPHAPAS